MTTLVSVGFLSTTMHLFDALSRTIQKSARAGVANTATAAAARTNLVFIVISLEGLCARHNRPCGIWFRLMAESSGRDAASWQRLLMAKGRIAETICGLRRTVPEANQEQTA